jgi:hypothetical protein
MNFSKIFELSRHFKLVFVLLLSVPVLLKDQHQKKLLSDMMIMEIT